MRFNSFKCCLASASAIGYLFFFSSAHAQFVGGFVRQENSFPVATILNVVYGTANLSIPSIVTKPVKPWVVVKVEPDSESGMPSFNSGSGGPATCSISGQYYVIGKLVAKSVGDGGRYEWSPSEVFTYASSDEPFIMLLESSRVDSRPDLYKTYVVCELNAAGSGKNHFHDVSWIPEAWTSDVAQSVKFYQKNRSLLSPMPSKSDLSRLGKLVSDSDPLIAISAVQILLKLKAFSPEIATASLGSSDLTRNAVIADLFDENKWLESAGNAKIISTLIEKQHRFALSAGVAIGLTAAYKFDGADTGRFENDYLQLQVRRSVMNVAEFDIVHIPNLSPGQQAYINRVASQ